MFSDARWGEGQGGRYGVAADESGNQDGGQSPSKTSREEFRIQEMFGAQEGVLGGLRAREGKGSRGSGRRTGAQEWEEIINQGGSQIRKGEEGLKEGTGDQEGGQKLICPVRGVSGWD